MTTFDVFFDGALTYFLFSIFNVNISRDAIKCYVGSQKKKIKKCFFLLSFFWKFCWNLNFNISTSQFQIKWAKMYESLWVCMCYPYKHLLLIVVCVGACCVFSLSSNFFLRTNLNRTVCQSEQHKYNKNHTLLLQENALSLFLCINM